VRIVARTREWLRYEVSLSSGSTRPAWQLPRAETDLVLLRLIGRECDVCLRRSEKPEFDAWRWHDYWIPEDAVIEFKRVVYQRALSELSSTCSRADQRKS